MNSLRKVLEVEVLCSLLLENSIVTTLLFVPSADIVVCAFAHLSIPFSLIFVVVAFTGTCSIYLLASCLCRVLNDITVCVTIYIRLWEPSQLSADFWQKLLNVKINLP